ncbi:uncharacterized protein K460DRAFT_375817 [Cucurbitaria berberidis CBS 394.84]|uniref:DUF8035 domain-containing protein n=1 Tax=Cucurbitaria berberidis CBS 394.84 TaxID=1168544 RepID=A0A9P4GPZ8_9PLEO|nr:uncharacterized protein K460DRAFT_375817 [Cucurbitaria berberidis CBS 394.84]KAF1849100.1 hypothetical protein K460DRAFT_375817 [Cucurbitaria berberidis CBS 394.84]
MLGSVTTFPSQPQRSRRNTYTGASAPSLPPRPTSLSTTPAAQTALQLKSVTLSGGMESRYNRPSSPRGRYSNPARSSTGTFADPYYDSSYYGRPSSPRTSADRITSSYNQAYYMPSSSSGARASNLKYDSYTGRPRRNTNEHSSRPNVSTVTNTSLPIRTPYTPHGNLDRPASPIAQPPRDKRADTYITPGVPRREHKKVYSVDDSSRSTKLVAEREVDLPRHRDSVDRGYSLTSGGRSYHSNSKPPPRLTDLGDDGYSYTDPASMYRDTEPAWRRPRAGSLERSSRPTSMIVDRPARSSARELGPPVSTRGFDKINNGVPRPHARSSSIERSREIPKYDPYPDATPTRSSSTRHHAPAIHQEPRDVRRETYHDDYDRRDREVENRRQPPVDRFEDREVTSRGFGIAPGNPSVAHDQYALERQPHYTTTPEITRRPDERSSQYYPAERASGSVQMPEPRVSRERDVAPPPDLYDKRPREREGGRQEVKGYVPAAAGAAAGVAATLGAAGYMKSREKEREREHERNSSEERERERRKEHDERDRRDRYDDRREDRRERRPEERRDPLPPPPPPSTAAAPPVAGYAPTQDADRKPRERRHDDDDRVKSSRKTPSSEGSEDERPRHYVDRDAERRKEPATKEAALDPDEEYRRRIQQEAERSSRATHDRDLSDSDRERDRRRRKDDRDRSRGPEDRSRASPPDTKESPSSRYDKRSSSVYDSSLVQEPESFDGAMVSTSKSVQIVTPPKEAPPAVKSILRRPTAKFPEDPEPIREGVAPHKDALKGKDIPVGARWTRIDRRLVNPEALEQAKERFEERMDCVIVLRVLTKQEIQKLADRTKKIRETREDEEYDHRDRGDKDKRSSRSSRDDRDDEDRDRDRDRERRHRYDDESDYDDLGRERERERPKMLEPAR